MSYSDYSNSQTNSNIPELPSSVKSYDDLHNYAAFSFLNNVPISKQLLDFLEDKCQLNSNIRNSDYNPEINYFAEYRKLYKFCDNTDNLKQIKKNCFGSESEQTKEYEGFVTAFFVNNNGIFSAIAKKLENSARKRSPDNLKATQNVFQRKSSVLQTLKHSPERRGSLVGAAGTQVSVRAGSGDFRPQGSTSLTGHRFESIKYSTASSDDEHKGESDQFTGQEYRMGTQAQLIGNGFLQGYTSRVSPLFKEWLRIQHKKNNSDQNNPKLITHVYFNLLYGDPSNPLYGDSSNLFKFKALELEKTKALEDLNKPENKDLGIAVVTLPASGGWLMSGNDYKKTDKAISLKEFKTNLITLLSMGDSSGTRLKDFYISPEIRKLVFGENKTISDACIQKLFNTAIKDLGFDPNSNQQISIAERQAIAFHFFKYTLPNHILSKLQPKGFNFTCKDGIDRGGVASMYFNVMYAIQNDLPFTQDQLDTALHSASHLVKGREVNHQRNRLWNAIDVYIRQNRDDEGNSTLPDQYKWLVHWRNNNCPEARVKDVLEDFVTHDLKHNILNSNNTASFSTSIVDCKAALNGLRSNNSMKKALGTLTQVSEKLANSNNQNYSPDIIQLPEKSEAIKSLKFSLLDTIGQLLNLVGLKQLGQEYIKKAQNYVHSVNSRNLISQSVTTFFDTEIKAQNKSITSEQTYQDTLDAIQ